MILDGLRSVEGDKGLILDGTGSVGGDTCWYLVVLSQYRAVMVGTWWYWVIRRRYQLILGGTGSIAW